MNKDNLNVNGTTKQKKQRPEYPRKRACVLLFVIVAICSLLLIPQVRSVFSILFKAMKDPEALQEYIRNEGSWAPFIFILIQILQVIIAPIPGNVTTIAGGMLFGSTLGFIYGSIGLVLGSTAAFFLARFYGKPFVIKFTGEETYEKYSKYFTKKSRLVLFLLFLFPFFPDDMLCILAGISSLTYGTFLFFVIFARLPGVYVSVFIGSGTIHLPIWTWVIIAAVSLTLLYLSARYGDRLEDLMLDKVKKITKRK